MLFHIVLPLVSMGKVAHRIFKKHFSVQKHLETEILFLSRRDLYKTLIKSENTITVVPPINYKRSWMLRIYC